MLKSTDQNLIDIALDHARISPFYHQECGDNMFIAGGCCTRVYYNHNNLLNSDIDIFCNAEYREFLGEQLHDAGFVLSAYNKRVSTFTDALNKVTFQCIEFPYDYSCFSQSNCNGVLDDFDISACRLVYMYGKLIPSDPSIIKLLEEKKLRVYNETRNTTCRIIKYMSRYQLTLDLNDPYTAEVHKNIRLYLLNTFPEESPQYDDDN